MSSPDPKIAAEIEAAYAERAAQSKRQMPFFRDDYRDQMTERAVPDEDANRRPVETYRVELWPSGRSGGNPEVVSIEANHPRDALFAAAEKHGNATGMTFEDAHVERAATWQPAPAATEGGRAR